MENKESQTRKSKAKDSKKPKNEAEEKVKKSAIWKWLFLVLLALNLAGIVFVAIRVTTPRDQTVLNQKSVSSSDQKVAQISSTTSQLNEIGRAHV